MQYGNDKHESGLSVEEELLYQYELRRRRLFRDIGAGLLALFGIGLMVFSFFPLAAKSAMPLLWIEEANRYGWNANLQEIGSRLLADGRIELMPMWICYTLLCVGAISVWLAAHLFRTRNESRAFGDLLTIDYWTSFYWVKK